MGGNDTSVEAIMKGHTLILGGGFGGLASATMLSELLGPEHRITVVDKSADFMMGLRKLWIISGRGTRDEGSRSRTLLAERGISFVHTEIRGIDPETRSVTTDAGPFQGDNLVIALGAVPDMDLVPGFTGLNLYDSNAAEASAAAVAEFGGIRLAIGILGAPYKCPPAPFEAAFLLHEMFERDGRRPGVRMAIFSVLPSALPVAGPRASALVEAELTARNIDFMPGRRFVSMDASGVQLETEFLRAELVFGVPPHRPPKVVRESPLASAGGWIETNPHTLSTAYPGVYAIGDCTAVPVGGGKAVPKAGIFAERQGEVVAARIAAGYLGGPGPTFDGRGHCVLELNSAVAARLDGEFYLPGEPRLTLSPPSEAASVEKADFERVRLARWLPVQEDEDSTDPFLLHPDLLVRGQRPGRGPRGYT